MKYHGTRSAVPAAVGMLCLLIYTVPVLIRLKNADIGLDDPKLKWLGIGAAVIFTAGTIGGLLRLAESMDLI